jgi:hypothetical protein
MRTLPRAIGMLMGLMGTCSLGFFAIIGLSQYRPIKFTFYAVIGFIVAELWGWSLLWHSMGVEDGQRKATKGKTS